ncbi:MAG: tetratricopeptide repeat protein [Bacteroidales bacterium]|nr:tetratricopeptide repeat protein [Bacteroidales bacterium]
MNKLTRLKSCGSALFSNAKIQLAVVLLLTFLLYLPALKNGFTNWDDTWYITENDRIDDFSPGGIAYWFTHYFHGQYSPVGNLITMLVYAVQGMNPFGFHLVSVVLHLLNVVLVYVFIQRLTALRTVAMMVALLFAVHPMQTESIAWAAAVKIPLYVCFTLIALVWYLRYIDSGKWKWYGLAFIPFLLAFGSKEQSVAIVGSLVFIDYYRGRKLFSKRVLLEKIPWVALAVLMGLSSVAATASYGIVTPAKTFGVNEQIILPSFAFITYLWKLIIPAGLTAIYPYPADTEGALPWFWYLCTFLVLTIIALFVGFWKKNRTLVFSIGFFVVNILLVLQIIPTRNILLADRYVYLSAVGFFFLVSFYLYRAMQQGAALRRLLILLFFFWIVMLTFQTVVRNRVWNNPETLWQDVITKQPDALIAWYDLGGYYSDQKAYEKALNAYEQVLRINPAYLNGLYNAGNTAYHLSDFVQAEAYYKKALLVDPEMKSAALNLYMTQLHLRKYTDAAVLIEKLKRKYPGDLNVQGKGELIPKTFSSDQEVFFPDLLYSAEKAFQEKRYMDAIATYTEALALDSTLAALWFNRGNAYFVLSRWENALFDYNQAIRQDVTHSDFYYNRGMALIMLDRREEGCRDLQSALEMGNQRAQKALATNCK